jgi:hypothetical protein
MERDLNGDVLSLYVGTILVFTWGLGETEGNHGISQLV